MDQDSLWNSISRNYKGKEESIFKDLVVEILPILKPGDWRLVEDYSGKGRKFEIDDAYQGKVWADYGLERTEFSLRSLSPSLVMAVNKEVEAIYFFSIHKIAEHTKHYLGQYQERTGTQVFVYDDYCLEIAIMGVEEVMKQFFGPLTFSNSQQNANCEVLINFSKDPQIEYFHGQTIYDSHEEVSVQLYSIFVIDVTLNNDNPVDEISGSISFEGGYDKLQFLILGEMENVVPDKIPFFIGPGGLFYHRFYFKVMRPGTGLSLPNLEVQLNHYDSLVSPQINPSRISVSNILQTPLIGKKITETLSSIRGTMIGATKPNFFLVHGKSGTGKSRLLREIQEVSFTIGALPILIDEEAFSSIDLRKFLRIIFSRVFRLPVIKNDGNGLGESSLKFLQSEDIIYETLYNNEIDLTNRLSACVDALFKGAKNIPIVLLVDNVQNFAEPIIEFLSKVLEKAEEVHFPLNVVSCFNSDILFSGTPPHIYFEKLMLLSEGTTFAVQAFEVSNFSNEDVISYLDHCFHDQKVFKSEIDISEKWPLIVSLFQEKILNRPLFLEQTLLYLSDKNCLKWNYDQLFVTNVNVFLDSLQHLPSQISSLLSRRWGIIEENTSWNMDNFLRLLVYISPLPVSMTKEDPFSNKSIELLLQRGIIKQDFLGNISFFHFQLFIFFKNRYLNLSLSSATQLVSLVHTHGLENTYFFSYFYLLSQISQLEKQIVKKATSIVSNITSYQNFLPEFLQALTLNLTKVNKHISNSRKLKTLKWIGRKLQVFEGAERADEFHKYIYPWARNKKADFLPHGKAYFIYVREYISNSMGLSRTKTCRKLLLELVNEWPEFTFKDDQEKELSLADVKNRLCVVYKNLGERELANIEGKESLKIAEKHSDIVIQIKNYIDLGHVVNRNQDRVPEVIHLWEKAVSLYHKYKDSDSSVSHWRVMVQLYEGLINLMKGNCKLGLELFEDGIRYCEAKVEIGYGIRFRNYFILGNLVCSSYTNNFEFLRSVLDKAIDRCVVNRQYALYWKTLFILAVFHLAEKREGYQYRLTSTLLIALESFQSHSKAKESINDDFFRESAILLRKYSEYISDDDQIRLGKIIRAIGDFHIKNSFKAIMNLQKESLEQALFNHEKELRFKFEKVNFPF